MSTLPPLTHPPPTNIFFHFSPQTPPPCSRLGLYSIFRSLLYPSTTALKPNCHSVNEQRPLWDKPGNIMHLYQSYWTLLPNKGKVINKIPDHEQTTILTSVVLCILSEAFHPPGTSGPCCHHRSNKPCWYQTLRGPEQNRRTTESP